MPRACPVCQSRKWRKDAVTGSAVCEEGHIFQDFRSENLVVENTQYTLQKRTFKKQPGAKRRTEPGTNDLQYYHGAEAEYLKMQALQVLLRLQVNTVRQLWNLPEALEMIARDLWAYQLAISPLPEVPDYTSAVAGEAGRSADAHHDSFDRQEEKDNEEPDSDDDDDKMDAKSSKSSASSKNEDILDGNIDPELLAEMSERSTDSEAERRTGGLQGSKRGEASWKRKQRLRASDTIVTLITALWVLRVPFMLVDIEGLVNRTAIPYVDFGHTAYLPREMRQHLNRETMGALCPPRSPKPMALFRSTIRFARVLKQHFAVVVPEANIAPTAWRTIESLGGAPTTYSQVMRLLALLDVNTSLYPPSYTQVTRSRGRLSLVEALNPKTFQYQRASRYKDVVPPELSVAAGWAVVMQMTYGLDGEARHVLVKGDPAIGLPNGRRWIKELQERTQTGVLREEAVLLDKHNFSSMALLDVDLYLDQCEIVLLRNRDIPMGLETSIFDLPTAKESSTGQPSRNKWDSLHAMSDVIRPSAFDLDTPNKQIPLMPGEALKVYDATDITGTLPPDYQVVLEAAAQVTGVSAVELSEVIETFEKRLEKARLGQDARLRSTSGGRRSPLKWGHSSKRDSGREWE